MESTVSTIVISNPGPRHIKAFLYGVPSGPGYGGMSPSDGDETTSMVTEYVIAPGDTAAIDVPAGARLVVRELGLAPDVDMGPSDGG